MSGTEILNGNKDDFNNQTKSAKKVLTGVCETRLVDIEFRDLCYSVRNGLNSGKKAILNKINGNFYAGELTAILGPSGSGKTTLLNILAGYGVKESAGSIKINDQTREYKTFHKLSAYIMQDIILQPLLTVQEAMVISSQLKLGSSITFKEKLGIIDEILTVLGLKNCCDTMSERLSGGESRRLSIALELVSNPPVIFLDEPTSGLDSVTTAQCLQTLKVLAKQGRTIICSIHQPSASTFELFDQVYFMANGMCVYNGSPDNTLSYLSSLGLPCPTTYCPSEYIIEVVQINQEHIPTIVEGNQNGKKDSWHQRPLTPIKQFEQKDSSLLNVYRETTEIVLDAGFVTSFWTQFTVLLRRMMLQQRRNKLAIGIQVGNHIFSGILFGSLFYNVGNNARSVSNNYGYGICVMVFFIFTHVMLPILLFPTEVKLVKREYYNRWYGLTPYYMALTLRSLPSMIMPGTIFLATSYLMTRQPLELSRFASFAAGGLLIALASEGLGQIVGSLFNVANGAVIGPSLIAPQIIVSVYGMGYVYSNIALPIRIAMALDYMRFGASAIVIALLSNKVQSDKCFEIFCPYTDNNYFLRLLGMSNTTYTSSILTLLGYVVLFKFLAYFALKYRLNQEISHTCTNYVYSLIKSK